MNNMPCNISCQLILTRNPEQAFQCLHFLVNNPDEIANISPNVNYSAKELALKLNIATIKELNTIAKELALHTQEYANDDPSNKFRYN